MLKRILMGIGGTPFTSVAIERSVELAVQHHATIKAVTVVNPKEVCKLGPVPPGGSYYAKKMCQNRLEVTQQHIEDAIDEIEERCSKHDVALTIERETGDPFELIIDHARYHDLTIFGLRSLFEYQLVSDPEKDILRLLSKGVRPIIAVSKKFRKIKNVMVAYDGSVEAANAMQHFVQLKLWPDAALNIIHIGNKRKTDKNMIDDAAAYCTDHGYAVKSHWITGKAPDQLLPAAQQIDADMIVMGRSVRSLVARHVLGDTMLNILTQTERPLFLSQ